MGFLHDGHISLMKRAKEIADTLVTTLFVNPTQFGPNEDFERYPRDFERDCSLATKAGVDFLFNPPVNEMYPGGYLTSVNIGRITDKFEGSFRPGHFNGVATIVSKLFNATQPHYAVFGQKDYQQSLVIRQMTRDLLFGIKIVVASTLREPDGLAMSSRNIYLNPEERKDATILYRALDEATTAIMNGEKKRKVINAILHKTLRSLNYIKIDYASAADADSLEEPDEFYPGQKIVVLIAVYLGRTRLIDNALVTIPATA
jgi:pantoate--beta-alanine ligase